MRLIHATTLVLHEFFGSNIPPYVILSHTWNEGEVSFQDMQTGVASSKRGFDKIKGCCKKASDDGFEYAWVDTCCIDKTSSAELSEAINSMYRWYKNSEVCYVYLSDFDAIGSTLSKNSRWFSRGWTLQELIAPSNMIIFSSRWTELGTKWTLRSQLSKITGIQEGVLLGDDLQKFSVAQRMFWASHRKTTRVEDSAYCLMGIFGVNMPMLYGEGERAFIRLQEEIMRINDDHTIFAWESENQSMGLLANSPTAFSKSGCIIRSNSSNTMSFSATNKGTQLHLPLIKTAKLDQYITVLDCENSNEPGYRLALNLKGNVSEGFVRHPQGLVVVAEQSILESHYEDFYVKRGNNRELKRPLEKFFVRFEPVFTFCDVYPGNWFQTNLMVGNATPFHGDVVAVIKFRNEVGWSGLLGNTPSSKTFAMVLMMRRELLVARLLIIDDSEIMEELFWSLSRDYSSYDKFSLWRHDRQTTEISDRLEIVVDKDVPSQEKVYVVLSVRKQVIKTSSDKGSEKMYVVNVRFRESGWAW